MRPGEGERRALRGYVPQYRVAAVLILRQLRGGNLEWIKVADPEAGRVDDIQIATPGRIDAYQVKWSQPADTFSFRDFTREADRRPSLIAQLADGWKRLSTRHPGSRVVVHFVTNDLPSNGDGGSPARVGSFAAFLDQSWHPARAASVASPTAIAPKWRPMWDDVQRLSGLPPTEFLDFLHDCELEFTFSPPVQVATGKESMQIAADIEHLTATLLDVVTDARAIVALTERELLARLGWSSRVEFRSRHVFPVDEALYTPIEPTVQRLETAVATLRSGYIGVLGTPGSGKSTLLTQALRSALRVIRYYAFVPDSMEPLTPRGESLNFLHDLCLALERTGFPVGETLSPLDRTELLRRVHRQIQMLHEDWRTTGTKTVIVIDGLDHIAREMRPERTLLDDLPRPEQIPEGVLIVLGSQTPEPFPSSVRAQIEHDPARHIDMERLPRAAVIQIIGRADLSPPLSVEQQERLHGLSMGHPLALAYMIQQLRAATREDDIAAVLSDTNQFRGTIAAQYTAYWAAFADDHLLVDLFGCVARIRGAVDMDWVSSWAAASALRTLGRRFAHYFRREGKRWYFFHNSFRLFLVEKTTEFVPGEGDDERNKSFHRILAARCMEASSDSPHAWEALYHYIAAGNHDDALHLATQSWFREQIFAFRPPNAIRSDARFTLRESVAAKQDPVALARLILIGAEIAARSDYLKGQQIPTLLVDIGEPSIAAAYVYDGATLRMEAKDALALSRKFAQVGINEEARRIFDLAEPLDLLAAATTLDPFGRGHEETLSAWATAAPYFRSMPEIVAAIAKLRVAPSRMHGEETERPTHRLRNRLRFAVGLTLLETGQWGELRHLYPTFSHDDERLRFSLWMRVVAERHSADDTERARQFLDEAQAIEPLLGHAGRTELAEAVFRVLHDPEQARALIADVPQPPLALDAVGLGNGMRPFAQRLKLNRLRVALGQDAPLTVLVPDDGEPRHRGMIYFERAVCTLARLWGAAWSGHRLTGAEIVSEILPALRLFNVVGEWSAWYVAEEARSEFYQLVIRATALHGQGPIEAVRDAFMSEWGREETAKYWPVSIKRAILLALHDAGADREWIRAQLGDLEPTMLDGLSMYHRVEECYAQARGWIACGDRASARRLLGRAMRASFAIGPEKDHQLGTWIDWMATMNAADPPGAAERVSWFTHAVIAAREITDDGRLAKSAANRLLTATFRWSPRRAVRLLPWLRERGIIWHDEAVLAILGAALENPTPPTDLIIQTIAHLVFPIATEAHERILTAVIEQHAKRYGEESACNAARGFVTLIEVFALPPTRKGWRRGVARALRHLGIDLGEASLNLTDLGPEPDRDVSSSQMKMRDGSVLSLDEVLAQVGSVADIAAYLEEEAQDSTFSWEPVIRHLLPAMDRSSIFATRDLFAGRDHLPIVLATLSERLLALGARDEAWTLAQRAWETPNPFGRIGWSRYWDGGRHPSAAMALLRIDAQRARPMIWEALIADLVSDPWSPREFALDLDEILPLLTADVPVAAVWAEIDEYVRWLFEGIAFGAARIEEIEEDLDEDGTDRAVADLALAHTPCPIPVLAHAGMHVIATRLLASDRAMQAAVAEGLRGPEGLQERLLMTLDAVSDQKLAMATPFSAHVARLTDSANFAVREMARTICARLNVVTPSPPTIELPTLYRLALPPRPRGFGPPRGMPPVVGETLSGNDPAEIVRPFDEDLGHIAAEAGVSPEVVCHRAVQIMHVLAPFETWSDRGERQVATEWDAAHVPLAFTRPRAEIARRAMFHVVTELRDSGQLTARGLDRLQRLLRHFDASMVLVEPVARPSAVLLMPRQSENWGLDPTWIDAVRESIGFMAREMPDGRRILAEDTRLRRLDHGSPEEVRASTLSISVAEAERNDDFMFGRIINGRVAEYSNPHLEIPSTSLIIRNVAYGFATPYSDWLALNPTIGHALGWTPSRDGLFQWRDADGRVAVETILWGDGVVLSETFHRVEVGHGWLVVASPTAFEEIKACNATFHRAMKVTRSYRESNRDRLRKQVVAREQI